MAVFFSVSAHAALVSFQYAATVRTIDFGSADQDTRDQIQAAGIVIGGSVFGSYTYDTTIADVNANPQVGRYLSPMTQFSYQLGTFSQSFDAAAGDQTLGVITVRNNDAFDDLLELSTTVNGGLPGQSQSLFALVLRDSTGNSWDTDELPSILPFLADIDSYEPGNLSSTGMFMFMLINGSLVQVEAELTRITPVPLPAGGVLLGSALASLAWRRRQKCPA